LVPFNPTFSWNSTHSLLRRIPFRLQRELLSHRLESIRKLATFLKNSENLIRMNIHMIPHMQSRLIILNKGYGRAVAFHLNPNLIHHF
jgi:hypothetical protein